MLAGLAGSLRIGDIPWLVTLRPDILGFRGGLCESFERARPLYPPAIEQAVVTLREASAAATVSA